MIETIKDANVLVEKWIARFPKKDLPISDLYSFQYSSETALGISFSVLQPKAIKDLVVVVTQIAFHPYHVEKMESLDTRDRGEFIWDLKRELLFWPPDFHFDDPDIPKSIQFSIEVYFDELTMGRLQEALNQTTRCVLWVAWSLGRKFGAPTGEQKNE